MFKKRTHNTILTEAYSAEHTLNWFFEQVRAEMAFHEGKKGLVVL